MPDSTPSSPEMDNPVSPVSNAKDDSIVPDSLEPFRRKYVSLVLAEKAEPIVPEILVWLRSKTWS